MCVVCDNALFVTKCFKVRGFLHIDKAYESIPKLIIMTTWK